MTQIAFNSLRDLPLLARNLLRGMWRFRWKGFFTTLGVGLTSAIYVLLMPDFYIANARVFVDTESTLKPLLRGLAVPSDVMAQVQLMTRALLATPQLEELARQTDMDHRAADGEEFEQLIEQLRARISISGGRDNIFSVQFQDADRATALKVVDTIFTLFVEDSIDATRSNTTSAQKFLAEQVADLESRLNAAEAALADFKKQNVGVMPDDRGNYYERLQIALAAVQQTQAEMSLAANRRAELLRQLEGEEPVFGLVAPPQVQGSAVPADTAIAQYRTQLAQLRLRYTDKHPEIIQTLQVIEELEAQRATQRNAPSAQPDTKAYSALDLNPVYQQMKISLSNTEVELAALRAKLAGERGAVTELQQKVDTIPRVEADLTRLTRDYDTIRDQYTELLQRLESARLSERAEQNTDEVQFRIIEPPSAPIAPSGPNRGQLLIAGGVFALLAGLGVTLLLSQLQPVFFDRKTLRDSIGLPVVGLVTLVPSARDRTLARLENALLPCAGVALVGAFFVILTFSDQISAMTRELVAGGLL